MKTILTKSINQLAEEASTITTTEERDNFLCDNFVDILDIAFMTDRELKEYLEETRRKHKKEFAKNGLKMLREMEEKDKEIDKLLKEGNKNAD